MIVRLVTEYRRGTERFPAGTRLEVSAEEAQTLIEDGDAVPAVGVDADAAEIRVRRA